MKICSTGSACCASWTPRILSILRIMSGLMLLQFGTAKILHFPEVEYFMAVQPMTLPWIAGVLELVGGSLLVLGLFTRAVAFILAGEMAFAYFIGHASKSFFPIINQGIPAILFCFTFLYIAFAGGGAWALDCLCKKCCKKDAAAGDTSCSTGCCKG